MAKGKDSAAESAMPKATVGRLSLYLRQLEILLRRGEATVASNQLGPTLGITDAQVRKDLAYFGQFGYPGIGYRVDELRDSLRAVLGTNRRWRLALVGIGNLGRALLGYRGFKERGFVIAALFDHDPALVGMRLHGLEIYDLGRLPEVVRRRKLELAILTVPANAAEEVAKVIAAAGITGILNFAPVQLRVSEAVNVVSVDLGLQLEQLVFQVNQRLMASNDGPLC